jgi:hypothetical protein
MPEFVADQIVAIFGFLRRGDQDRTSGIVRNLTGREPHGLAQFARDHGPRLAQGWPKVGPRLARAEQDSLSEASGDGGQGVR